jgi:hypothetical protein
VDPVPDPLLLRKPGSAGNRIRYRKRTPREGMEEKLKVEFLKQKHFHQGATKLETLEYFNLRTNAVWQFEQVMSCLKRVKYDRNM